MIIQDFTFCGAAAQRGV